MPADRRELARSAGGQQDAGNGESPEVSRRADEACLERARELAWRALNRRDRTVAELRAMLAAKDCEAAAAETVVTELLEHGYLDDARYARRFAEDRRRLDAWGRGRIARRLRELGVGSEHTEAALAEPDSGSELDRALELLDRRFPALADDRQRSRALGMLVRRGFEAELAYEALRRHAAR